MAELNLNGKRNEHQADDIYSIRFVSVSLHLFISLLNQNVDNCVTVQGFFSKYALIKPG